MKILAVDTATEACSAALYIDGDLIEQFQIAPREHTKLILQMIEILLQQADINISDLNALAFGRGPGSFTGVRIATGIVQGLAFANDLPVLPVSTLASIAQLAYDDHQQKNIVAGIDARMGGMYWGCYRLADNGLMVLHGNEQVSPPDSVVLSDMTIDWVGAGSAWSRYSEELKNSLAAHIISSYADYLPHSRTIAQLAVFDYEQGRMIEASQALPVYLRDDVAKKAVKNI